MEDQLLALANPDIRIFTGDAYEPVTNSLTYDFSQVEATITNQGYPVTIEVAVGVQETFLVYVETDEPEILEKEVPVVPEPDPPTPEPEPEEVWEEEVELEVAENTETETPTREAAPSAAQTEPQAETPAIVEEIQEEISETEEIKKIEVLPQNQEKPKEQADDTKETPPQSEKGESYIMETTALMMESLAMLLLMVSIVSDYRVLCWYARKKGERCL